MGKVIYRPHGKAKEYSNWACNLYVGCDNACTYCFNKRGVLSGTMGGNVARLKKCIKDEDDAYLTFVSELSRHRKDVIRDGGLLFSFSTDPCLPGTIGLTFRCVEYAVKWGVRCRILTKRADWINDGAQSWLSRVRLLRDYVAVGFTLTGMDGLEPGASPNEERIRAMRALKEAGVTTFASIEPVVDFGRSLEMVRQSVGSCDHYKVGLLSGDKDAYDRKTVVTELEGFIYEVDELLTEAKRTVYWKKSVTGMLGYEISDPCCVGADYDLFNTKR